MSTSPKNQDALLFGRQPPAARQPKPGTFMWAVRLRDGITIISCELRDHGTLGVEVQLLNDGQWFFGRNWPNQAAALVEVDDLKAEHVARGGVLLPDR